MSTKWNNSFNQAAEVLEFIEQNGYEAYFVGGCVRDLLLDRRIKDIDIASTATPSELNAIFDSVIPVGLEHGTVLVRYKKTSYEITTFRGKWEHNNEKDNSGLGIENDLEHRDFTINAMAMNRNGKIYDKFSGRKDLQLKIIRSVKHPNSRFLEDPLRILRAIRFVSQLGFTIEQDTLYEMKKLKHHLELVSIERITSELDLIFQGNEVQKAIDYIKQLKLYKYIPVWKDNYEYFEKLPNELTSFESLAEVIALFYHLDNHVTISTYANYWKCSNQTKRDATLLAETLTYYLNYGINNWLAYKLPNNLMDSFIHLIEILTNELIKQPLLKQKQNLPITHRSDLEVNGNDLKTYFNNRPNGRWISNGIEAIEYQVVMKKINNNKTEIKEWILCHPPAIN